MKRILLGITLTALISITANAQIDSAQVEKRFDQIEQEFQNLNEKFEATQNELKELRSQDRSTQSSVYDLSTRSEKLSSQIDSLQDLLQANSDAVSGISQQLTDQKEELSGQISETRETTSQSVSELDEALSKNTLYWIIAVLAVGLLSILAFIFLRKKVTDNQSSINESLASTRRELEQEAIRLDEKLVGVMETQMKIIQEERKTNPEGQNGEQDHSLALKVADEIVRIEKNISRMDEGTKGLKQLSKAVERIRDNFASNGYEMIDMIGKPFDDGLKCTANFRPDDSLEPGQKIITRIIKPQVNFKGRMIQSAQIEVSQGE
jgi:chromosome segregation ATPase